ncbi:MAG: TIGR01459 family HAD-type hydrolase [Telmatospirillum sp.]|nr:TIGR01459 family HAD-type hydrolase [Telmatospirillum sp.]
MSLPILGGLKELPDRYQGCIIDLWGVIHDGITPYPGAIDALTRLKASGRRVVMLSNAPRRSAAVIALMDELGIARELYLDIVTSGEAVYEEITTGRDPWFRCLGRRCLHVGGPRDRDLFVGLDLDLVKAPSDAQFLLVTGPEEADATVEDFAPLLREARSLDLPLVCANPDLVVIHCGRPMICAGSLALFYEELGGDVRYRGKPDPAIYDVCLARLGLDRSRVIAIGDGFPTDVAGARAAGLDCLFCTGGIHAEEIGTRYGERPDPDRLEAAILHHGGLRPAAAIGGFVW